MAQLLKQSTTVSIRLGPFLDKADAVTEKTALSPAVEVSKNHGAFAARNSATAVTHDSNGWYAVELNATDTNTLGPLIVKSDDAANHLPVWREFTVLAANVFDSLVGNTDKLQVDLAEWLGTAAAAPTVPGVPEVDVTHCSGAAQATISTQASVDAVDDYIDTEVAAIKAKTDALPSDPADQSLIIAATDAIMTRLGTPAGASVIADIAANGETRNRTGTAQAGSSSTITLDAGASAVNDFYKNQPCAIVGGTGAGQSEIIASYVGATKVATMSANWATAPDATSQFRLLPMGTIPGATAPSADAVAEATMNKFSTTKRKVAANGDIVHYQVDGVTPRGTLRPTESGSDVLLVPQ